MMEKSGSFMSDCFANDAGQRSSPDEVTSSGSSPSLVPEVGKKWPITVAEFDEMFDNGEDIDHLIDWSSARRPGLESRPADLQLPDWILRGLDAHAQQHGMDRQALVTAWLAERLRNAT